MVKKKINVSHNENKENIVINPKGIHHPDSVKGIEELTSDELKLSIQAMENMDPVIWVKQSDMTKLNEMIKLKDHQIRELTEIQNQFHSELKSSHSKNEVLFKENLDLKSLVEHYEAVIPKKEEQFKKDIQVMTSHRDLLSGMLDDRVGYSCKLTKELEVVKLERDIAVKSNEVSLSELSKLKESLVKTDRDYNDLLIKKDSELFSQKRNIDDQQAYIRILKDDIDRITKAKVDLESALRTYKDLVLTAIRGL